jgi:hypothetical protein
MKAMKFVVLALTTVIFFIATAGLTSAQTKNPNAGTGNKGALFVDANGDGICDNFNTKSGVRNGSGNKNGSGKGFGMKGGRGNGTGICDGTGRGNGGGNGTGICDGTGPKGKRGR